jgi:protein O-mannosyl-transferase
MNRSTPYHSHGRWIPVLLLIAATVTVYLPVCEYEFIDLDDDLYVFDNFRVQSGLTWTNIVWALTAVEAGFWHPLTWLSHMLDCHLFGLNPAGHHLVNLVLHTANVVLLFWVLQMMTGAVWLSALVAVLFGLHPLNVESVAWIAERKNVLSTFFGLLAIWAYVTYVRRPQWKRYLLLLVLFVLGLMSKPMLVTLPCVLLLLDYWPLGRLGTGAKEVFPALSGLVMEKVPLFLLSLAIGLLAILAENRAGALPTLQEFPLGVRLGNAVVAYTAYLSKTMWPTYLVPFYPHAGASLATWQIAVSLLVLVGISALAGWGARAFPYLLVGWLWYLGTLFPVSGVIQVGGHAMADRYAYVTLIGIFIMLVWGSVGWLIRSRVRKQVWIGSIFCLLILISMNTRLQLNHWQNSVTLFEHVIRSTDNNSLAHNNLGTALLQRGRIEEAIEHFSEALRIRPDDSVVFFNLGLAVKRYGEVERAARYFSKALELNPDFAGAHNNLGMILMGSDNLKEAISHFVKALELNPGRPEVHTNLGSALARQGDLDAAITHFVQALQINPRQANAYSNLGAALDLQGRSEEAVDNYRHALRLDPSSHFAHHNLGMLLLEQGNLEGAADHLSKAIEVRPDFANGHHNLGLVRMQQGRIEEAIQCFRQVLKLNPDDLQADHQLRLLLEQSKNSGAQSYK